MRKKNREIKRKRQNERDKARNLVRWIDKQKERERKREKMGV